MVSELEQKFYKVFEISPATVQEYGATYLWDTIEIDGKRYTLIDDRKLLEMICIILNVEGLLTINTEGNIADIKDFVLRFLIGKVSKNNPYCHYKTKNKIKQKIQQLFKEQTNERNRKDV